MTVHTPPTPLPTLNATTLPGADVAFSEAAADGFLLGGPVKDHDIRQGHLSGFDCEIYSLHTRERVQGKGLGRALIAASAAHWAKLGKRALMLWAYSDNAYRKFYEKIGGECVAEGIDEGVPDVAYGWRDLGKLISIEADKNTPHPDPLPASGARELAAERK